MAVGKAISTFEVTHPKELPKAADPAVGRVAVILGQLAAEYTPVDTGTLKAGWRTAVEGDAFRYVFNAVEYARAVEFGTVHTPARAMLGRANAETRRRYGS